MSQPIKSTVTVRMKVKPEKHDEFLQILEQVTESAQTVEPDCFLYATWKTDTPFEYLMVESYWSDDGRREHERLHKGVARAFLDCLAEMPVVETLGDVLFSQLYTKPEASSP